jgi:hypothetical protein
MHPLSISPHACILPLPAKLPPIRFRNARQKHLAAAEGDVPFANDAFLNAGGAACPAGVPRRRISGVRPCLPTPTYQGKKKSVNHFIYSLNHCHLRHHDLFLPRPSHHTANDRITGGRTNSVRVSFLFLPVFPFAFSAYVCLNFFPVFGLTSAVSFRLSSRRSALPAFRLP